MKPPRVKRLARWLGTAALLAAVPKCIVCVLAYAGIGAALGLGGPENCGDTNTSWHHLPTWLVILVGVALATSLLMRFRNRKLFVR